MRFVALAALVLAACGTGAAPPDVSVNEQAERTGLFAKDNLIAWCIVPFDASKRGPAERAAMLERLGLHALAYDYRDEHIPTFDEEIAALRAKNIRLASWWCGGVDPREPLGGSVALALDALKRNEASSDLWVMMREDAFKGLSQQEKVALAAEATEAIAAEAAKIQGRVGLYNHGGWFGEPENQLAIVDAVKAPNVGMVYNFHHSHEHFDRLKTLFPRMAPHLLCVNLNGMTPGGEKIVGIGKGERDREMLELVMQSGYDGPIGILDHRNELDAEASLQENLDGLAKLVSEMH